MARLARLVVAGQAHLVLQRGHNGARVFSDAADRAAYLAALREAAAAEAVQVHALALLDSEQFRRVFVNLIDNALAALSDQEGERLITISTSCKSDGSALFAEVGDTGHGIQPAAFQRLFQPYFSTRGTGTGLGLAIVQRIVLEHRGRIQARANFPQGAKFVIELPTLNT